MPRKLLLNLDYRRIIKIAEVGGKAFNPRFAGEFFVLPLALHAAAAYTFCIAVASAAVRA